MSSLITAWICIVVGILLCIYGIKEAIRGFEEESIWLKILSIIFDLFTEASRSVIIGILLIVMGIFLLL